MSASKTLGKKLEGINASGSGFGSQLKDIGLGRSGARKDNTSGATGTFLLDPSVIDFDPYNPRQVRPQSSVDELQLSIETNGQLQPCVVRKHPTNGERYVLEKGEGRVRAVNQSDKVEKVWCTLRVEPLSHTTEMAEKIAKINAEKNRPDYDPIIELEAASENCGREDMHPLDIADSALRVAEYGISARQYAERTTVKRSTLGDYIKIAKSHDDIREAFRNGRLVYTVALTIAKAYDNDQDFVLDSLRNKLGDTEDKLSLAWAKSILDLSSSDNEDEVDSGNETSLSEESSSVSTTVHTGDGETSETSEASETSETSEAEATEEQGMCPNFGQDDVIDDLDSDNQNEPQDGNIESDEPFSLPPSEGIMKRQRSKASVSVKVGNQMGTIALDFGAAEPDKIVVEFVSGEIKAVEIEKCTIVGYE